MNRYKIFVSGGAGFIGSLVLYNLVDGVHNHLEALDNFSSYYDSVLKVKRFDFFLEGQKRCVFYKKISMICV